MAISTLFPSGLGLDVGILLNSSKLSLALVLCLILAVLTQRGQFSFRPNMPDILQLYFIGWLIVGAIITGMVWHGSVGAAVSLAADTLYWVFAYLSFYFVGRLLPIKTVEVQALMKGMLFLIVVCALVGLLESIFRKNFYGEIGQVLGLRDAGSGTELWRGSLYRARSSLDQSIAFGFAMIAGFVLADYLMKIGEIKRVALLKILFASMVLLSGSRSAFLVLLMCLVILNYGKLNWYLRGIFIIGGVAIGVWVLSNLDHIFFVDESLLAGEESLVGQSGNLIGRFQDFMFVLEVLDVSPMFGIGSGLLHNDKALMGLYPTFATDYDGALDNMVLSVLVEYGVSGLVMAALVIIGLLNFTYKMPKCPERTYLGLMVFLFMAAAFSYDLLVFPGTGRLLLLLVALGISAVQIRKVISRIQ